MKFPEEINLEILESKHPEYDALATCLSDIELLSAGGYRLKNQIKKFIPQRGDEDNKSYEARLANFTYLNILSTAINEQVSKIANSPLDVSGVEELKVIEKFREDTNLKGRNERDFLSYIFAEVLKFKKLYCFINSTAKEQPINKADQDRSPARPFTVFFSPSQVISWHEDGDKVIWIKVRQVFDVLDNPLDKPKKKTVWTFITSEYVAKYEAETEYKKDKIDKLDGSYINKDTKVKLVSEVKHAFVETPVYKFELSSELWVGDQILPKAMEHLRHDCIKSHLLNGVYIQRFYKRIEKPVSGVPDEIYETDSKPLPTSLNSVLELENFNFAEPSGAIIERLTTNLKNIEDQVRDLVSLGGVSASYGATQQSGYSKEMDFQKQEVRIKKYGELICSYYQKILRAIATAAGTSKDKVEKISVTGLNSFEKNSIDTTLERLERFTKIDISAVRQNVGDTAFLKIHETMVYQMVGNPTSAEQEQISSEIKAKMAVPEIPPEVPPVVVGQ